MKRSEHDNETMDPVAERELEALDRALTGLPVDEDMKGLAELVSDLRETRPGPDPDWAAELDVQAAAGFRGRRRGTGASARLKGWLGSLRLGQVLAPAGALATLAVVAVVGVSVTADDRDTTSGGAGTAAPMMLSEDESPAAAESAQPPAAGSANDIDTFELPPPGVPANAGIARGAKKRLQDRSAVLTLKTDTTGVREVSDEVIQITESAGGVVLSSNLTESDTRSTATLELAIPTRELDTTLDRLTDLATVASLNEAAQDITKPFVSAEDRLKDAEAERDRLLDALSEAEDGPEAESLRAQLKLARNEIARARAQFENIARRARLANVNLTIKGTPDGSDDGNWGLGDAADDALEALKTVAGVMLVGAAIVLPILALIAALIWLGTAARRHAREKTLDD